MAMSHVGLGNKNYRAGEDQQQFSSQVVSVNSRLFVVVLTSSYLTTVINHILT
jgi:hypothetical protein